MKRTLTVVPQGLGGELRWAGMDAGDDLALCNYHGRSVLLLRNRDLAAPVAVTARSTLCSHGRPGDIVRSVGAGETAVFGPFPRGLFNRPDRSVLIETAGAATSVELLALEGQHRGDPMILNPRTATLVVAASDASTQAKNGADYVCDGVNDQEELQAAIDALPASGGRVVLSEGRFYTSAAIEVLKHNVVIEGQGISSVVISDGDSREIDIFDLGDGITTYANLRIANLKIDSVGQKTSNTGLKINRCFKVWIDKVYIEHQYRAVHLLNATQVWITNCPIRDTKENGITIESDLMDGFDWYIAGLVMDNQDVVNTGIGIEWLGGETLHIAGADVMNFATGMVIAPPSGKECRWAFVEGLILDTCSDNGLKISNEGTGNVTGLTFTNSWVGSNANYGVLIERPGSGYVEGIRFIGLKAMNNGLAGFRHAGGRQITVDSSDFVSNSATVPGARAGIEIAASEISVLNCRCTNGFGHGASQDWGIRVDNAAIDNYMIVGCDLRGNVQAAGLIDEGTGVNKVVANNLPL